MRKGLGSRVDLADGQSRIVQAEDDENILP